MHPGLESYLEGLPADRVEKVIVRLAEQADIRSLNGRLRQERVSLARRHREVVECLLDTAEATQAPLVGYLEQRFLAGEVRHFTPFWIDNMIGVEATVREIRRLAGRPGVGAVYLDHIIEGFDPVTPSGTGGRLTPGDGPSTRSVESGIAAIRAPEAWALGCTGAGRLVANIDTGVDGGHEALASRWRGLSEPATECWFDPVTSTTFPFDAGSHGTHTMGTTCGHTAANGIGVAPDARWIAAGVINRVDIPTTMTDAVAAFQWVADPDGDPGTVDDVPDAVGNSWGLSPIYHGSYITGPCDETFWAVMDNCEAAGCAVVFSAGGGGPGAATLSTPADRADSPYNAFAVGAVDATYSGFPYPAASFSSRGPGCDGQIKPEVVAPGVAVRSAVPGGGYSTYSGTSMATPHVTGCFALLRQVAPDLDVDTMKEILLATAVDLGGSGEDNTYGMGIVDLEAAVIAAAQAGATIAVGIGCQPDSGTLPFSTHITVLLDNRVGDPRRVAARLALTLAGGAHYDSFRSGYVNLSGDGSYTAEWNQYLPAMGPLAGQNLFTITGWDVTPAPYNQPPYLPSGDSDTGSAMVTGLVP
jgi:bacillopeptidase F